MGIKEKTGFEPTTLGSEYGVPTTRSPVLCFYKDCERVTVILRPSYGGSFLETRTLGTYLLPLFNFLTDVSYAISELIGKLLFKLCKSISSPHRKIWFEF